MGAAKELWMTEVERVGEEYAAKQIEVEEFRARMKALGFDRWEIDEHQSALDEDRNA